MPYSWRRQPFHPSTEKYKNAPTCYNSEDDAKGHRNLLCPVDLETQPEQTLPDIQSRKEAVRFLKSRSEKDDPFFLAVGFHKPHVPFKFPREFLQLFPLETIPLPKDPAKPELMPDVAWNPWRSLREREDIAKLDLPFPYGPMPANYTRLIKQHYYAAASYTDDQIGLVLAALAEGGRASDETVVVLLGDHGWSLGEHQEWAKFGNFDVDTRVPLIIHDPRTQGGLSAFKYQSPLSTSRQNAIVPFPARINSDPVELLDVFPTLVDLASLPVIPTCPKNRRKTLETKLCTEGQSLVRIKRHRRRPFPVAFSQYPRPSVEPQRDSDKPRLRHIRFMGYSARTRRFRYTRWVAFDPGMFKPKWEDAVAEELYDHVLDPGEDSNSASSPIYREVLRRLRKLVRRNVEGMQTRYARRRTGESIIKLF